MKVLIPAIESIATMKSQPSSIYGRAKAFAIYDTITTEFKSIEFNENVVVCKIAHDLKEMGIDAILANTVCTPCYANLHNAGIDIWKDDGSVTIRESVQKFLLCGMRLMTEPGNFVCAHQRHTSHEDTILETMENYQ